MNEQLDQIQIKLAELEGKIDEVVASTKKMRAYAKWTAIITIGVIVVPLLLIPLFLPAFLASQGIGGASSLGL
jgi:uncharacterized membrane protein YkvA (DUF1232 family)